MKKQDRSALFSAKSDDHITPPDLYNKLNSLMRFVLDPCTDIRNPLNADKFYTIDDGQSLDIEKFDWNYDTFINPPYSEVYNWVKTVHDIAKENWDKIYCMLLPSRTDRPFFQEFIINQTNTITFLPGRLRFYMYDENNNLVRSKWTAPFPSLIATFGRPVSLFEFCELEKLGPTKLINQDHF